MRLCQIRISLGILRGVGGVVAGRLAVGLGGAIGFGGIMASRIVLLIRGRMSRCFCSSVGLHGKEWDMYHDGTTWNGAGGIWRLDLALNKTFGYHGCNDPVM